ncbi:hypothetical protein MAIC_39570 [Mycolicibacterium aichiense]|uniref:Uncharacterized protein n=1 Tax=Mycolicibacterium aichiense TaxID=1799 RepID=A0AAD1MEF9_9MYCO|nr:hypothetical protein MAIC_39570 [Mycolicibacterium aichiense]
MSVRFGGAVGESAADAVRVAAVLADVAVPDCTTDAAGSVVAASAVELESAAAAGVAAGVMRRAADVDFAGMVRLLAPGLTVPVRLGAVVRPVPPTFAPVLLCADDGESSLGESAWATPVAPFSAAQTPRARAPVPNQIDTLL